MPVILEVMEKNILRIKMLNIKLLFGILVVYLIMQLHVPHNWEVSYFAYNALACRVYFRVKILRLRIYISIHI